MTLLLSLRISYSRDLKSAIVDKVLKQLQINDTDCYFKFVTEQIIPYSLEKSVIVIPKIINKDEESFLCDLYILIVSNSTGMILSKFYEQRALISDATYIDKISIDFAPYILSLSTRAFGLRVLYYGSSRPYPWEEEVISLFIPKGKLLIRVLKNYTLSLYSGESDTQCKGKFERKKGIIIMSDSISNTYSDIIVRNEITTTINTVIDNDCIGTDSIIKKTIILKFNNKEYK